MLQDVESGRALEAEALIGSVIELARMAEVATPHIDALAARGIRLNNYSTHPICSPARAQSVNGVSPRA